MNGIVNRERRIYRRMDRFIGAQSDASPVIPVVEKDGELVEKRSSAADTRQLTALCEFVREKMREFGKKIVDGDLAVNPYIRDGRTGCDTCPYGAVCGFDKKTPGYEFRRLGDLEAQEIWQKVQNRTGSGQE